MSVLDGLAEMSGVRMCAAPSCFRRLTERQGMKTKAGVRMLHTCYGFHCVEWAERLAKMLELS